MKYLKAVLLFIFICTIGYITAYASGVDFSTRGELLGLFTGSTLFIASYFSALIIVHGD